MLRRMSPRVARDTGAPGDQVLAVLRSGKEEDLRKLLLKPVK